jgi:hypothetical protein
VQEFSLFALGGRSWTVLRVLRKRPVSIFQHPFRSEAGCSFRDGNITADTDVPYHYYDIGCAFPPYAFVSVSTITTRFANSTVTQVQYQTQTVITTSVQTQTLNEATVTRIPVQRVSASALRPTTVMRRVTITKSVTSPKHLPAAKMSKRTVTKRVRTLRLDFGWGRL